MGQSNEHAVSFLLIIWHNTPHHHHVNFNQSFLSIFDQIECIMPFNFHNLEIGFDAVVPALFLPLMKPPQEEGNHVSSRKTGLIPTLITVLQVIGAVLHPVLIETLGPGSA